MAREMLQPSFMSASPTLSHDIPVDQPPDRLPWQEQHSPRLYSVGRPLQRTQFVLSALIAVDRWKHEPKTAVSIRIARIVRRPLPSRGFHQIRTCVRLRISCGK